VITAPKAILFDMGGTLVDDRDFDLVRGTARLLAHAVDTRGLSPETVGTEAERLFADLMPARDACGLELPCRCFQKLLYDRLGITFGIGPAEMEREFWCGAARQRPQPGIAEALGAIAAAGIRMGVVSNTMFSGEVIAEDIGRQGLLGFFEVVISSADYGVRKPRPLLFEMALKRMGVEAADAWYAGDRPEFDVAGAHAAGLTAILYDPAGKAPPDPAPDATLRAWRELPVLIGAAGVPG
jgi:putative hydrolase of the HAD superfamily